MTEFFFRVLILSEILIFKSNLFHSTIVEGKKVFLKKSGFTFIEGILLHCLVLYDILCMGNERFAQYPERYFSK